MKRLKTATLILAGILMVGLGVYYWSVLRQVPIQEPNYQNVTYQKVTFDELYSKRDSFLGKTVEVEGKLRVDIQNELYVLDSKNSRLYLDLFEFRSRNKDNMLARFVGSDNAIVVRGEFKVLSLSGDTHRFGLKVHSIVE